MLLEMSMMPLSACPLWQTENPGQTAGECNDAARSYTTPQETIHSVRDRAIAFNLDQVRRTDREVARRPPPGDRDSINEAVGACRSDAATTGAAMRREPGGVSYWVLP